jgi:hypothetical protein
MIMICIFVWNITTQLIRKNNIPGTSVYDIESFPSSTLENFSKSLMSSTPQNVRYLLEFTSEIQH